MAAARKPFKLRKLEPHTAAKHALLRKYMGAWFPVMAKYNPRVVYYDAFAGPGKYQDGEPGSPMIALESLVTHDAFARMTRTDF